MIIRKNARFPYYSDNLVEKSLSVHIPNYEMNNIMPTGTLDNAGVYIIMSNPIFII